MNILNLKDTTKFSVTSASVFSLLATLIIAPVLIFGSSTAASADMPDIEVGGTVSVNPPLTSTPGSGTGGGVGLPNVPGGGGGEGPPPRWNYSTVTFDGVYQDGVSKWMFFTAGGDVISGGRITCNPNGQGASAVGASIIWQVGSTFTLTGTHVISYTCNYPTYQSRQPIVLGSINCYYNFSGNYYFSDNRAAIANDGTFMGNRPQTAGDPSAPSPASGRADGVSNCNQDANRIWWRTQAKDYGYYRIAAAMNYKTYTQWGWPSWMNKGETWWEAGGTQAAYFTNWYAYSCSNTSTAFEGPMQHWQLPQQGERQFDVSKCPQVTWQCNVSGPLSIGNGLGQDSEVMRDGNDVQTWLPGMSVSGNGVRNNNGSNSPVSDNDMRYKVDVNGGSTPMNGTDVNNSKQYFKLFSANKTQQKFGQWYSNPNANRTKYMQFYWASESSAKPFQLNWDVQFTAQFLVPRSDTVGGPTSMQWVTDTTGCPNTPINGNKATVIRSTSGN